MMRSGNLAPKKKKKRGRGENRERRKKSYAASRPKGGGAPEEPGTRKRDEKRELSAFLRGRIAHGSKKRGTQAKKKKKTGGRLVPTSPEIVFRKKGTRNSRRVSSAATRLTPGEGRKLNEGSEKYKKKSRRERWEIHQSLKKSWNPLKKRHRLKKSWGGGEGGPTSATGERQSGPQRGGNANKKH